MVSGLLNSHALSLSVQSMRQLITLPRQSTCSLSVTHHDEVDVAIKTRCEWQRLAVVWVRIDLDNINIQNKVSLLGLHHVVAFPNLVES